MADQLLSCPFCGDTRAAPLLMRATARTEDPYDPADRVFPLVRCTNCGAEAPGENEDYKGDTAVVAWNRRAAHWTEREVRGCSSCGKDHPIGFQRLVDPVDDWTHVGRCAYTGEPVWMRIT